MKALVCLASSLLLILAQATAPAKTEAEQLFVVHFATGPGWDRSIPPGDQIGFDGHSGNLRRLRAEGVIVFGARYGDLGMIIVPAGTLEEAAALFADDPGVESGIFTYRVARLNVFYPWREAAAGQEQSAP